MTNRFASARTFREGSVGLLILLGLGAFGVVLLWLNRFTGGNSSYKAIIEFSNAGGMQKGASVRYRGVKVGSISRVKPGVNGVEVEIQIAPPDLIIPSNSTIEANQSGLINESIIDITPKGLLPTGATKSKPLDQNCNKSLIICNGSRLKGMIGISTDALIRESTAFSAQFNDKKLYQNLNTVLERSATAASSVAELTKDLQRLSRSFQGQMGIFSGTAVSIQRATNQLTATSTTTANQFGSTAKQFGSTAQQLSLTANQASRLLNNLDNLLTTNRSSLVSALNNITQTSNQLRQTVTSLSPAVNRLTQGEILKNLETLSANAALASANLRDASKTLNDPKNIILLQQTLDSARATFENTQKITSDLDELTGDPKFRKNLLQLVNGLSKLVSSTKQMQEDTQVAVTLDALKASVSKSDAIIPASPPHQSVPKSNLVISQPTPSIPDNKSDLIVNFPSAKTFVSQSDVQKSNIMTSTPVSIPSPIHEALSISPTPLALETTAPQISPTANSESSQQKLVQELKTLKK